MMLLAAISTTVVLGLDSITYRMDVGLLLSVATLAWLAGWALDKTRWRAGITLPLGIVVGFGGIAYRLGQMGVVIGETLRAGISLLWQTRLWPFVARVDGQPLQDALSKAWEILAVLATRLYDWLAGLLAGKDTFDPVAANLAWGLVFWLVFLWAGWAVFRRRQPLAGVLPAAALLAGSLNYVYGDALYLLPVIAAVLMLMALARFDARLQSWLERRVDYAEDISMDVVIVVVPLVMVITAAAAVAPSLSIRAIAEFSYRITHPESVDQDAAARALGFEWQPAPADVFAGVRAPGLPRAHLLGAGPELSKRLVFTVAVESAPDASGAPTPQPGVTPSEPPPVYYWRSVTYDVYTGRGWLSSPTNGVKYSPSQPAFTIPLPYHKLVVQTITPVEDLGELLYATGVLVAADREYEIAWRAAPTDGSAASADPFGATLAAKSYTAQSLTPSVSVAGLRAAPPDYPGWVTQRYLQLPESVPQRVLGLARDLTAAAPTPYDRAVAIETHLRNTFPYTLDVGLPPGGDLADYFLFDLKKGFCDYFATSMVVLARAAGLPARMVSGYASGTYDTTSQLYLVTEADAHSWVEIYFSGIGWVEFEPTAARAPFDRPDETAAGDDLAAIPGPEGMRPAAGWALIRQYGPLGLIVIAFLWAVLFLGYNLYQTVDGLILGLRPPASVIARLYRRLFRAGRRLTGSLPGGVTPHEFAAALQFQVESRKKRARFRARLAPASEEIRRLVDLYARTVYSEHLPTSAERSQAIQLWQSLRGRLWWARLAKKE